MSNETIDDPNAIVAFGDFSVDALERDAAATDAITGNLIIDLEPGDTVVRFLPPMPGQDSIFRVTAQHYIDPIPGVPNMVVFACPRTELKQPCFICATAEELTKSGNPLNRDRAYRLQPKLRVFANVINRANPDAGVRVLAFGKQVWEQIKMMRKNARSGGNFSHPLTGFDVVINRVGTGKNDTEYTVTPDRTNSPLSTSAAEINAWLTSQHDLNQFVNPTPPPELVAAWDNAMAAANVGARQAPPQVGRSAHTPGALPARPGPGANAVGAGIMGAARRPALEPAPRVVQTQPAPARSADPFDDE